MEGIMPTSVSQRTQKRRDALRAARLRPVQIWVPNTRQLGFADERRRQSALAAAVDLHDPELDVFLEDAAACTEGWE